MSSGTVSIYQRSFDQSHLPDGLSKSAHQTESGPSIVPNFESFHAELEEHGVPSIVLKRFGPTRPEASSAPPYLVGNGLTSRVVRHTMDTEAESFLPPSTVVALKIFSGRDGPGSRVKRRVVYDTITKEIQTFRRPRLASHPNIVQLLCVAWSEHSPYPMLALEFGEWGSLEQVMRNAEPPLTASQKLNIMVDIAFGLQAIHECELAHGDLKPANIIIFDHADPGRSIVAKLSDFGGSADLSGKVPTHLTPMWCAPEVINEDFDVDWKKADIYAYGLVVGTLWARGYWEMPDVKIDHGLDHMSYIDFPLNVFLLCDIRARAMSARHRNAVLWCYKSGPELDDAGHGLKKQLEEMGLARLGIHPTELMKVLEPTLRAIYWLRPCVNELVKAVVELALCCGQHSTKRDPPDIHEAKVGNINIVQRQMMDQEGYNNIIFRELENDFAEFESFDISFDDIPSQIREDTRPDEYLRQLDEATVKVRWPYESAPRPLELHHKSYVAFVLAAHFLLGSGPEISLAARRDRALEWIRTSALHGSSYATFLAATMLPGTRYESGVPMRLYCVLAALKGSGAALELVFERWPDHYHMIRRIKNETAVSLMSQIRDAGITIDPPHLPVIYHRFWEPSGDPPKTLKEVLNAGALRNVEDMLGLGGSGSGSGSGSGTSRPDDFEELIPSLLHRLSNFRDVEAALLAKTAYEQGARLDLLAESTPEATELLLLGPGLLSPLSAAICRGQGKLAMAIYRLHMESNVPIPDFPKALALSFAFLQPDIGAELLKLLHQESAMCIIIGKIPTTGRRELLWQLLLLSMAHVSGDIWGIGEPESVMQWVRYKQLSLHGAKLSDQYTRTLQLLLEYGADPTDGPCITSCPLSLALVRDDISAFTCYIRYMLGFGRDTVSSYLQNPRNFRLSSSEDTGTTMSAPALCIAYNAIQCFKLLLHDFPDLIAEKRTGEEFVALACSRPWATRFVDVILPCIDPAAIGLVSFEALRNGNPNVIEEFCKRWPGEYFHTLLDQWTMERGEPIFSSIVKDWSGGKRRLGMLDSLKWLVEKRAANFRDSSGNPVWRYIVAAAQPTSRLDVLSDVRLFEILLDCFSDKVDTPCWEGVTLLHMAVTCGQVELVRTIVQRGFDANVRADESATWFAGHRVLDIAVVALLRHLKRDRKNGSPLDRHQRRENASEIVKILRPRAAGGEDESNTLGDICVDQVRECALLVDEIILTAEAIDALGGEDESLNSICRRGRDLKNDELADKLQKFAATLSPLQDILYLAKIRTHQWRLPPGWAFDGYAVIDGSKMPIWLEEASGTGVWNKPPLWCEGHDAVRIPLSVIRKPSRTWKVIPWTDPLPHLTAS